MKDFQYPDDIYTEAETDPNTLANLGPLARLAGVWEGKRGVDINPKAEGPEKDPYIERYEAHPTDGQTNGPQLYYGLRYHAHIVQPGEVETFHDQVGYWLWEPETGNILLTGSIPRGQTFIAVGNAPLMRRVYGKSGTRFTNKRYYFESVLGAFIYHGKF